MDKLKTFETLLMAVGALIAAAKWIVKLIGYLIKLSSQPKTKTPAKA